LLSPSYDYALQQYQTLLKERNELLKGMYDQLLDDVMRSRMIALGIELRHKRAEFLNKLNGLLQQAFSSIYGDGLQIDITYLPNVAFTVRDVESYLTHWQQHLATEQRVQQTQVGPHRDDFQVNIGKKNVAVFGSQGQQRMAVVSLKLALLRYMSEVSGIESVVLLDDVLSELDEIRRHRLLSEVKNHHQVIITLTQPDVIHDSLLDEARFIEVSNGKVFTEEKE
jgi:DNA replication and repair protein RecF